MAVTIPQIGAPMMNMSLISAFKVSSAYSMSVFKLLLNSGGWAIGSLIPTSSVSYLVPSTKSLTQQMLPEQINKCIDE